MFVATKFHMSGLHTLQYLHRFVKLVKLLTDQIFNLYISFLAQNLRILKVDSRHCTFNSYPQCLLLWMKSHCLWDASVPQKEKRDTITTQASVMASFNITRLTEQLHYPPPFPPVGHWRPTGSVLAVNIFLHFIHICLNYQEKFLGIHNNLNCFARKFGWPYTARCSGD